MNSDVIDEKSRQLATQLFKSGIFMFGSFKLSSGVIVNTYLELILLFGHSKVMKQICESACTLAKKKNLNVQNVCGVSYAGIPFATLVANGLQVPLLMWNKESSLSPKDERIVGSIQKKTEVLVLEEVMCSGTSTLRTIKDLEDAGLVVKHVVVMIDLEQGGRKNLLKMGYQLHSVLKLSEFAAVLYNAGLINEDRMEDIRTGFKDIFAPNGDCITNTILEDRRALKYESRMTHLHTNISKRLFQIVIRKRTNLCMNLLSCDLDEILKTANQIGPYICILSIHLDLLKPHELEKMHTLKRIAQNHDFLLLDDRKLSEESEILCLSLRKILNFVDLVTVFPISGEETLKTINNLDELTQEKGVIVVGSFFTQDSLSKSSFERSIINLTLHHCPSVSGFVSHQNSDIPLSYVHIMQDIKTTSSTINCEDFNPYYSEDIIAQKLAADIVMVTTNCDANTINLAKKKQQSSWLGYKNRFLDISEDATVV